MPKPPANATQEQVDAAQRALSELGQAYRVSFSGASGDIVQKDLADFCRANESTWDADERLTYVLIGRREVWLKIQTYLNLTAEELFALRAPPTIIIVKENPNG